MYFVYAILWVHYNGAKTKRLHNVIVVSFVLFHCIVCSGSLRQCIKNTRVSVSSDTEYRSMASVVIAAERSQDQD